MLVLETAIGNAIVRVTFKRGEYQISKTIGGDTKYISTMDKDRAIELCNQFISEAKGV
jgi:coenzyme F420-reducing hydrogenase alpha subunit